MRMKLSPFMKKVEVEGGYRGFYRLGNFKYTVTVEDRGIAIKVDGREGLSLSSGSLHQLFKPMMNLWDGKRYVETMGEIELDRLADEGFVLLSSVTLDNEFQRDR